MGCHRKAELTRDIDDTLQNINNLYFSTWIPRWKMPSRQRHFNWCNSWGKNIKNCLSSYLDSVKMYLGIEKKGVSQFDNVIITLERLFLVFWNNFIFEHIRNFHAGSHFLFLEDCISYKGQQMKNEQNDLRDTMQMKLDWGLNPSPIEVTNLCI